MVDLHGVPRSQNGNDHSAARDGYAEWGDSDINETVEIIEFLSQRLICPKLYALQIIIKA